MSDFKELYTACLASGNYKYIDKYYELNTAATTNTKIVNVQLRYWIEAVEKFYNLDPSDYNEKTIEEGVLIINLLANSLLILGGMNDRSGKSKTPCLTELYKSKEWDLKADKPDLYSTLKDLNDDYNHLSKHINKTRAELLKKINYAKIKTYFEATRDIWKWVLQKEKFTDDIEDLFGEPNNYCRN